MLTGDDIHDTFKDLVENSYPVPWVSRVYIYIFVIMFITTVLNVFIFIIEDAYVMAKITLGIFSHTDMPELKELSGSESLRIIFQNIDKWKERMEQELEIKAHANEVKNEAIPLEEVEG